MGIGSLVALSCALAAANVAYADVIKTVGAVSVNWTNGTVTTTVVAPADRRAPSPQLASAPARRRALDKAYAHLVVELPRVNGVTQVRDAAWLVKHGTLTRDEPLPDGSWRLAVTVALAAATNRNEPSPSAPQFILDARASTLTPHANVTWNVPVTTYWLGRADHRPPRAKTIKDAHITTGTAPTITTRTPLPAGAVVWILTNSD